MNSEFWKITLKFLNIRRVTTLEPNDMWLQMLPGSLVPSLSRPYSQHREEKGGYEGLRVKFHSIYFCFPAAFAAARKTPAQQKASHPQREKQHTVDLTFLFFFTRVNATARPSFSLPSSPWTVKEYTGILESSSQSKELKVTHSKMQGACPAASNRGAERLPPDRCCLPTALTLVRANEPDPGGSSKRVQLRVSVNS